MGLPAEAFTGATMLSQGSHAGRYTTVPAIVADYPGRKLRLRRITGLHVRNGRWVRDRKAA